MKLNRTALTQSAALTDYVLPQYDVARVTEKTAAAPAWLHFGTGNIFRAFPAVLCQTLLNQGLTETGIVCCEGYDEEIITRCMRPFDNLSLIVTLCANGKMEKELVASVTESLALNTDEDRVREIFKNPSLQMVSFTITEKGYSLRGADRELLPAIRNDLERGPEHCTMFLPRLVSYCLTRGKTCGKPLALVSMDNCSHNGEKLKLAVFEILDAWKEKGYLEEGAYEYVQNHISFPWSMIDKITPRPHESVQRALEADGWEDMAPFVTSKNTYIAPFVNAEKPQYLVIEDDFPNGRPCLEKAGVMFTSRETVNAVEKMKVCTCLNPLHTSLAVFGCLLGYQSIAAEMKDEDLVGLIEKMSAHEGLPVVVDPGIIDPRAFLQEVLKERFPNPFIPDTPQRIATDTSQKLSIRFGEDIKLHLARGTAHSLVLMPLVFAGWLRYLKGVDDQGNAFACSSDPLLNKLQPGMQAIAEGTVVSAEDLEPTLSDLRIWGVDLQAAGLKERVVQYFNEFNAGPGAVRQTLHKYVTVCYPNEPA